MWYEFIWDERERGEQESEKDSLQYICMVSTWLMAPTWNKIHNAIYISTSGFGSCNTLSARHDVDSGGWLHVHCGAETSQWREDLSHVPQHSAWYILQVHYINPLNPTLRKKILHHPSLLCRYILENRVACEIGLYYVLHIAKLRNKNALQRLLPALGETHLINYISKMHNVNRTPVTDYFVYVVIVDTYNDMAFGDIFLHLLTGHLTLLSDEFGSEEFCSAVFENFLLTSFSRFVLSWLIAWLQ